MALTMQYRGHAICSRAVARSSVMAPARVSRAALRCRASAGAMASMEDVEVTKVLPLTDREHFRAVLKQAADDKQLLVVDYFTTWCGPCKLIAPEIEKMAGEFASSGKPVKVAKVTCDASNDNKKWAMDVQIRSLPTFRVYKGGEEAHVGQVVGTKVAELRRIIDEQLATL